MERDCFQILTNEASKKQEMIPLISGRLPRPEPPDDEASFLRAYSSLKFSWRTLGQKVLRKERKLKESVPLSSREKERRNEQGEQT